VTTLVTAPLVEYRMIRLERSDGLWTPIVNATGDVLSIEHLDRLAVTPDPDRVARAPRRLVFIIVDEGRPRPVPRPAPLPYRRLAETRGVRLDGVRAVPPIPLTLLPNGLGLGVVHTITRYAQIPGTTGRALVATATMDDSVLASIAWQAITAGILTAVSPRIVHERYDADGHVIGGVLIAAKLCLAEHACLPATIILTATEEEA
jgi:hypothetical protein